MKEKHIDHLLDENNFENLSEADLHSIENHVAECPECRQEYEAAQIASIMLRERAAQIMEPTAFFETRVLAAWRERQAESQPVTNRLRQMWQDARILLSGLATGVALLIVLTFYVSQTADETVWQASVPEDYSVESIVFDQPPSSDDLTDVQLLQEIYESDDVEK